jgi:hypothetical protein
LQAPRKKITRIDKTFTWTTIGSDIRKKPVGKNGSIRGETLEIAAFSFAGERHFGKLSLEPSNVVPFNLPARHAVERLAACVDRFASPCMRSRIPLYRMTPKALTA